MKMIFLLDFCKKFFMKSVFCTIRLLSYEVTRFGMKYDGNVSIFQQNKLGLVLIFSYAAFS